VKSRGTESTATRVDRADCVHARGRRRFLLTLPTLLFLGGCDVHRTERELDLHAHLRKLLRKQPIVLPPTLQLGDRRTLARIAESLRAMAPSWPAIKIPDVMHAIHLWGISATFDSKRYEYAFPMPVQSTTELFLWLTNDEHFRRVFPGETSLLVSSDYGIRFRDVPSPSIANIGSAGHEGELAALCALHGVPSSWPVIANGGAAGDVGDLVTHILSNVSIGQELEWQLEAIVRYTAPARSWRNKFGAETTIDTLVDALLARPRGRGACFGTHRLHTLAVVARIAEQQTVVDARTLRRVRAELRTAADLLERRMSSGLAWDGQWHLPPPRSFVDDAMNLPASFSDLFAMVTSIGHHLEWAALAPSDLRPAHEVIEEAAALGIRLAAELPPFGNYDLYLPLCHLYRALCLLYGHEPADMAALLIAEDR
jgi:hypothetical protein